MSAGFGPRWQPARSVHVAIISDSVFRAARTLRRNAISQSISVKSAVLAKSKPAALILVRLGDVVHIVRGEVLPRLYRTTVRKVHGPPSRCRISTVPAEVSLDDSAAPTRSSLNHHDVLVWAERPRRHKPILLLLLLASSEIPIALVNSSHDGPFTNVSLCQSLTSRMAAGPETASHRPSPWLPYV